MLTLHSPLVHALHQQAEVAVQSNVQQQQIARRTLRLGERENGNVAGDGHAGLLTCTAGPDSQTLT